MKQIIFHHPHRAAPDEPLPEHPAFREWECYVGTIIPASGDYEYFVEEAFRLYAAIESFGLENIWILHWAGKGQGTAMNLSSLKWKNMEELLESGAEIYGAKPGRAHGSQERNIVDDYCTFQTFAKYAGRVTGLGGFYDIDVEESSMDRTLKEISEKGGNRALLKRRFAKIPLIELDLTDWEPGTSANFMMVGGDPWALIEAEGLPEAYLVQEHVTMEYEYRFFVIGGKLVAGAGCLVELSPLDNRGERFDPRIRRTRFNADGDDDPKFGGVTRYEERPDIVERFKGFAAEVVDSMTEEHPYIDRYVIDVALNSEGEPLLIEFNNESNSGFYAIDPIHITQALAELFKS